MTQNSDIKIIAKMLTDDPDIINEAKAYHIGTGSYETNDVVLSSNGRNIYGHIIYNYDVKISGDWSRGSFGYHGGTPPESPELEIYNVKATILKAYDGYGKTMQNIDDNTINYWKQTAEKYFHKYLIDEVTEKEHENITTGE